MTNEREFVNEMVPAGIFQGVYQGFEEFEYDNKKTGKRDKCLRHFFQVEVNGTRVNQSCLSDITYRASNRFGKLVKALMGRDLNPLEHLKLEQLFGKRATLVVELREGRTNITNILPPQSPHEEQKHTDVEAYL